MAVREPRRLVQITHDLEIGGLQRVVVNLCRGLDRQRFAVSVLCMRRGGAYQAELEELGVPVTVLPPVPGGGSDYGALFKVARHLRRVRADVVHTHNTQPFVEGGLGAMLARVPVRVHTDHARPFPDKRRYMLAEWVMAHFFDRVVGVSDHTSGNLRRYERIPRRKLCTIPNGVDGTPFRERGGGPALRRELGIPPDAPVAGLGVRLAEQKGVTYLLQALPEVLRVCPAAHLLVAGDGPLAESLRAEAAALGVAGRVAFAGPRLDMAAVLAALDVYVLPSLWEGLPMVLLEAMAAGLAVVATAVGGVARAVETGRTGLLVPPADPAALAEAVAGLLTDPARRAMLGAAGQARFEAEFSARVMARRYEALYDRRWGAVSS